MIGAPSAEHIQAVARDFGLDLRAAEAASFVRAMSGLLASYARLDELPEPRQPLKYPRDAGSVPSRDEDPHGAWAVRTEIRGASSGPLAGLRVAVKDNVCVAGVAMRNGSRVLEGYIPDADATVVERVLDAGAVIVGKTTCEDLCFSGGSHTSTPRPCTNPRDPTRSAGGSSSGSAVALALGEADLALGGDQGGSIRIPAAWCGVVGLKPTYGLVPYTGVFPIELTLDHCGPMARSVRGVAALLQVIAGPDGLDPRQAGARGDDYLSAVGFGARGLSVGVLKEGFARPESDRAVDERVHSAAAALRRLGAEVREVSVPEHLDGLALWNTLVVEGSLELMLKGNALGTNWQGYYPTGLLDAFARGWRSRPEALSVTAKTGLLFGEWVRRHTHGHYYAKAQNLRRSLRAAYDAALGSSDVLLLPTLPFGPTRLPARDAPPEECVARAFDMVGNTAPFDVSGHPAISVPWGEVDGLPVGAMLVARHGGEARLLAAAAALEATTGTAG